MNRFSSATKRWERSEFFLEKFSNFNGCELTIVVPYPYNSLADVVFDSNGTLMKVSGEGNRIFEVIGENVNFAIRFNPFNTASREFYNRSFGEDLKLYAFPMRFLSTLDNVCMSPPFRTYDDLILISRSKPYTQFEKLFLPFEIEAWTWMIVTLSATVATIFVLRFAPKYVQNFVFGTRVQTPVMNLLQVNFHFHFPNFLMNSTVESFGSVAAKTSYQEETLRVIC